MKKALILLCVLVCVLCFISCKQIKDQNDAVQAEPTALLQMHIELQTIYCITDPIIIDDEETIAAITRYVDAANGQKGESAKGVFCTPYMFTLYYNDGKKKQFYLWSANTYSTSEDVDEEGYHMLYHADLQDMYEYVQSKYPVPKPNE